LRWEINVGLGALDLGELELSGLGFEFGITLVFVFGIELLELGMAWDA